MKKDYIPNGDAELDAWENTFVVQLADVAADLGLNPADVTAITDIVNGHRTMYANMNLAKTASKNAVSDNRAERQTTVDAVRNFVKNKIKASGSYTNSIGENLGIVGTEIVIDWATAKPVITATITGGTPEAPKVLIDWVKGQADGIYLYSKRGTEADFQLIGTDSFPPYDDMRTRLTSGQAEQRQYYAMYVLKDQMVGLPSDIITVNV